MQIWDSIILGVFRAWSYVVEILTSAFPVILCRRVLLYGRLSTIKVQLELELSVL